MPPDQLSAVVEAARRCVDAANRRDHAAFMLAWEKLQEVGYSPRTIVQLADALESERRENERLAKELAKANRLIANALPSLVDSTRKQLDDLTALAAPPEGEEGKAE